MIVEGEARVREESFQGWVEDESDEGEENDGEEDGDGSGEGTDTHRSSKLLVVEGELLQTFHFFYCPSNCADR